MELFIGDIGKKSTLVIRTNVIILACDVINDTKKLFIKIELNELPVTFFELKQ